VVEAGLTIAQLVDLQCLEAVAAVVLVVAHQLLVAVQFLAALAEVLVAHQTQQLVALVVQIGGLVAGVVLVVLNTLPELMAQLL
jgi:hypothetical protein